MAHTCQECGKQFEKKLHLEHHKNAVHSSKTYQCSKCQKEFGYPQSRDKHEIQCGQPTKKVMCEKCGKEINSTYIKRHEKICGTKQYCPKCHKPFNEQYFRVTHSKQCQGKFISITYLYA